MRIQHECKTTTTQIHQQLNNDTGRIQYDFKENAMRTPYVYNMHAKRTQYKYESNANIVRWQCGCDTSALLTQDDYHIVPKQPQSQSKKHTIGMQY